MRLDDSQERPSERLLQARQYQDLPRRQGPRLSEAISDGVIDMVSSGLSQWASPQQARFQTQKETIKDLGQSTTGGVVRTHFSGNLGSRFCGSFCRHFTRDFRYERYCRRSRRVIILTFLLTHLLSSEVDELFIAFASK